MPKNFNLKIGKPLAKVEEKERLERFNMVLIEPPYYLTNQVLLVDNHYNCEQIPSFFLFKIKFTFFSSAIPFPI